MSVFVIATSRIHDGEAMARYREAVPPIVAKYGGRLIARGAVAAVLEGEREPHSAVVFEFENEDQANQCFNSPEYAPLRDLRRRSSDTEILVVTPPGGAR